MKAVRRIIIALVLVAAVLSAGVLAWSVLAMTRREPLPFADQCAATVAGQTIVIDAEQAHNASIIAGVSTQRGLRPRAATIGLATAFQESGLRNLAYGDRDSLGLFQQRPSQGWGTPAQVMDPWFASAAFYAALVDVPGWSTGNVNDIAQTVQRSGHPYAYAKHVEKARRLASALTGETPAAFSCTHRFPAAAQPDGLATFLSRTLPSGVDIDRTRTGLRLRATSEAGAWSAASIVVANAGGYGVRQVSVGDRTWKASRWLLPTWSTGGSASRTVEVGLG